MMSTSTAEQITEMIEVLPESEQILAYEFVKRLVLAWDPDYTKVTSAELADIEEANAEYARGECVPLESIDMN